MSRSAARSRWTTSTTTRGHGSRPRPRPTTARRSNTADSDPGAESGKLFRTPGTALPLARAPGAETCSAMSTPETNTGQIAYWNEAAGATWVECQDALDTQLEPIGRRVIEDLGLSPGQAVLDVGCGCGQTTLALGEQVGGEGRAHGVDISEPMLEVARRRAADQLNVSFQAADAQTFAFEPTRFDAIHSRFG